MILNRKHLDILTDRSDDEVIEAFTDSHPLTYSQAKKIVSAGIESLRSRLKIGSELVLESSMDFWLVRDAIEMSTVCCSMREENGDVTVFALPFKASEKAGNELAAWYNQRMKASISFPVY